MIAFGAMTNPNSTIVNFLFEVGILSKTPRSGFYFLGSGKQSVAEHSNRTVYVGFALASMDGSLNMERVLKMCLFHDLVEGRTSDLNYVHQKYVIADEHRALDDLVKLLPFGEDVKDTLTEYKERKTKEALIAKDADIIEWILSLKEQIDTGSERAKTWMPSAIRRLKTEEGKILAQEILLTNSDEWWFSDKEDDWWVNRSKKVLKKRL